MVLKDVHDALDEIPEPYRPLYTEKNGKWECTGISGMKTSLDVKRALDGAEKERVEHKATKEKLKAWADVGGTPDEVLAKLDRLPELEAAAKGKLDEAQIEAIVERRVEGTLKSKLAPVERENKTLKTQVADLTGKVTGYEKEKRDRKVRDDVTLALVEAKVLDDARDDALVHAERVFEIDEHGNTVTRDGVGVPPGLNPTQWLAEIQPRKQHWFPGSVGGNAAGNGKPLGFQPGSNPWSADSWNLTEQGRYAKTHGPERAARAAQAAGSSLGATSPPKPAGASR